MSTEKQTRTWLTGLLTGWGIKESWAKIIAGAVIGALGAAGLLLNTGCGLTDKQVQQIEAVHAAVHKATGKPCIIDRSQKGE